MPSGKRNSTKDCSAAASLKKKEENRMKWSRYAHLFHSKRNGWLLYNSASNAFMQLEDEETAELVQKIAEDAEHFDFSSVPQIYLTLRSGGFLVKDTQDDDLYNILKMQRLYQNYATDTMILTVAITRACNFNCSYCYEHSRSGVPMTEEMADQVAAFAGKHKASKLHVVWYGGEPLLAFDRVLYLDKKLQALGKEYSAMLVTNGYLITEEICGKLNDLKVGTVQITLDGNEKTHNSRRALLNGKETFQVILNNLDILMRSEYKGIIHIRVNVDTRNEDEFIEVYRMIHDKYPDEYGKRISVYPGFVKGDDHPDISCFYDSEDKGRFILSVAEKYDVNPMSLFPERTAAGCTLTKKDAYVVGPEGELYKCWDDVGIPESVIGYVYKRGGWNTALIAEGMVGASYLDSQECRECFYFPVCDGGCHRARQKNLHDDCNRDCCSYFKGHLEDLLELHFEQKQKQQKS